MPPFLVGNAMCFLDLPESALVNIIKHAGWNEKNSYYSQRRVAEFVEQLLQVGNPHLSKFLLQPHVTSLFLDKKSPQARLHQCVEYGTSTLLIALHKNYEQNYGKQIRLSSHVLLRSIKDNRPVMTQTLTEKFHLKIQPEYYVSCITHLPKWSAYDNIFVAHCIKTNVVVRLSTLRQFKVLYEYLVSVGVPDNDKVDTAPYLAAYVGNQLFFSYYASKMSNICIHFAMECSILGQVSTWRILWEPFLSMMGTDSLIRLFAAHDGEHMIPNLCHELKDADYHFMIHLLHDKMTTKEMTYLYAHHCRFHHVETKYAEYLIAMMDFRFGTNVLTESFMDEALRYGALQIADALWRATSLQCTTFATLDPRLQCKLERFMMHDDELITLLKVGYLMRLPLLLKQYIHKWSMEGNAPCLRTMITCTPTREFLFDYLSSCPDALARAFVIMERVIDY